MNILLGLTCLELHPQAYALFCDNRSNNIWSFDTFTKSLIDPYSLIYIDENKIVTGFVITNHVLDEIEIEDICVSTKFRDQGIASALMDKLITLAQTNKAGKIRLEVAETNTPALSLYEKFNFNRDGIRKHYYRMDNHKTVDAVLMSLSL